MQKSHGIYHCYAGSCIWFHKIVANVRTYAQLPLQSAFMSGYPQDKQMNQHEQPLGPAIAYDRLLVAVL